MTNAAIIVERTADYILDDIVSARSTARAAEESVKALRKLEQKTEHEKIIADLKNRNVSFCHPVCDIARVNGSGKYYRYDVTHATIAYQRNGDKLIIGSSLRSVHDKFDPVRGLNAADKRFRESPVIVSFPGLDKLDDKQLAQIACRVAEATTFGSHGILRQRRKVIKVRS